MKLTDLDPHFLKLARPLTYKRTDDINEADAMELKCPACQWSWGRRHAPAAPVHTIQLWRPEPRLWDFVGTDYHNLSICAGSITATMISPGCHSSFHIKRGKVDFA